MVMSDLCDGEGVNRLRDGGDLRTVCPRISHVLSARGVDDILRILRSLVAHE